MEGGDRIAGRWEVEHVAASGGMSSVYRARDLESGERVAVKVIRLSTEEAAARFEREARLLAEFEHPSILRYLAHGSVDGSLYLVTEWLEGEDLGRFLRQRRLTLDESLKLLHRVAEALAPAHRRGIVHRDIKPGNVFLMDGDLRRVKLIDFGIARLASHGFDVTTPGAAVGTPAYMSPEQATGQRTIDARADVFALGCVLFRMIADRTPFRGPNAMAVLAKLVLEDAPPLSSIVSDVPADVDALCTRMLSRNPAARPANATAVVEELRALGESRVRSLRESEPPRALGVEERRLVSLVLVRHALPARDSSTGSAEDTQPTDQRPWTAEDLETSDVTTGVAPSFPGEGFGEDASGAALEIALRRIARRHGARLLRLADGSVVLTVSGGDVATDLASRAGRAALQLREELPYPAMALATGTSESGDVATVGDVIDQASESIQRCPPRSADDATGRAPIALDDVSAALLEHRFVLERIGDVAALGRPREGVDAPRMLLGRPTLFVGRDREMATLEAFFRECVAEPVARAVMVTGAPGSGKSRLRYELVERIAKATPDLEILDGAGDPLGAGSAFALLAGALRRRFGIHAGDPPARQHARIATVVSDVMLGEERDRVVAFLSEMIGSPLPGGNNVQLRAARQNATLMGDQMRRAWHDYLLAITVTRPVLLVLDDLQWGDTPSVKLVESALSALREQPLMVVAFGRPEVRTLFPGRGAGPRFSEIALDPLSKRACEQIARHTLGTVAEEATVTRLVSHCEGNPFFMEEMLRSSVEGRLEALPDTVLATLQSRMQSLESDARRTLRAAAVLGPTFWTGGVRALLGASGEDADWIDSWLRHLGEREWISMRPTSSVRDEVEWAFTQSSVRDAAYATLTDDDRSRGHRLAGDWLVAHGAADAMALAEHFERGRKPERAVQWFLQAARQSLEGDDLDAALARAERGLACAAASGRDSLRERRGMLHLLRAEAHRCRGENAETAAAAVAAMDLLEERSAARFFAVAESATAHGRISEHERVMALVPLFDRPPHGQAVEAYCIAASRVVVSLLHRGHHTEADAVLDAAERAAEAQEERGPQGEAAIALGRATQAHSRQRPAAALSWALRAVSELDRAGDRRNACMQRVNVGWAYVVLGHYARAREWLEGALEVASMLGLEDAAAMARQNLGLAVSLDGEPSRALPILSAALEAFARQQNRLMDSVTRCYLAQALMASGDLAAAETECRVAGLMVANVPARRCMALAGLASILRAQGRPELADDAALEAMAALREAGRVQEGEVQVRLEYLIALQGRGNTEEARAELDALRARIHACADDIEDEELKGSFLHGVAEHARILAMTTEGGTASS